jgi:hypothetical protein
MGKIILFLLVTALIIFLIGSFFKNSSKEQVFKVGYRVGIVAICTALAAIIGFVLVVLF